MFKGFRDFILRGNVVDLAVAVIIGAAFGAITASLTADVITPMISALFGAPDFSSLVIHVRVLHQVPPPPNPLPANYIAPGEIHIGKLLNTLINFFLVSASVYFAIILPTHYMMKKLHPAAPAATTTKPCPECLSEIPLTARRCAHCAQPVA